MAASGRFRLDWVLRGELLLGPAPSRPEHLDQLGQCGVRAVLSLCAEAEAPPPLGLANRFRAARLELPDHRSAEPMRLEQLLQALGLLEQLTGDGPVFVHCLAAMERSPLLCLAWLKRRRRLSTLQALDYLMQVHPGTSPLPAQLALLEQLP
jgi:hypothetical protein